MLAEDSANHPMTALLEVRYNGLLKQETFEAALSHTLSQHPLLQSVIDHSKRAPRWRHVPERSPWIDWSNDDTPLAYPAREHIDLTREIGLRIWVRNLESDGRIVFQLHHACTDGIGVLNFVLDVLRAYSAIVKRAPHELPIRQQHLLEQRDRFSRFPLLSRIYRLCGSAVRIRSWNRTKPISLSHGAEQPPELAPMEAILHSTLSFDEVEKLLCLARRLKATVNDLLLRDLFIVLEKHCEVADEQNGRCLSVCMPVNLREPTESEMPSSNKMMMTFLNRTSAACREPDSLLQSVSRETIYIKRTRSGVRLLEVMRVALALKGEIPRKLLSKNSFATAVLSNLGRLEGSNERLPTDEQGRILCGDSTIQQIVTAPNGRPGTNVVIVVLTYAGRMSIALRFDPTHLSREAAQRILDNFIRQLQVTIQSQDTRESASEAAPKNPR